MSIYKADKLNILQVTGLVAIGTIACYVPLLVTAVWAAVFLITLAALVSDRQDWIWYCIAASPIIEVWARMVKGAVVPDEIGKYYLLFAIASILIYHIKGKSSKPLYKTGILTILLLLPSLVVNLADFSFDQWAFNILPTLELGFLLMLASRERWDIERFAKTLQMGLAPIVLVVMYLILKTPAISSVNFMLGANFKAAGGGTNQVATVLGLGILYTMLLLLLKRPVVARWACYLLIAFLFFRSFLTFSRGGVFTAVASVYVAIGFAMIANRKTFIRYSAIVIFFAALGILVFNKVDELTSHKLTQRYSGETIATITGEQEKTWNKVTSGRTTLINADWNIFKEYFLFGVGPGGAKDLRTRYGAPPDSAAHTEVTRLMSEHGIGGLLAAVVLLLFPIYWLRKQRYRLWMGISAALFCMALLTSMHSAMRTNTTIVCYALASIPVYIRRTNGS
ncbi:MAG TPA: O-antigen ligase family protein [Flavipsychrobacter sp.]